MKKELAPKKNHWVRVDLSSIQSSSVSNNIKTSKKPKWLRVKLPSGKKFSDLRKLVDKHQLHTICESGNCPNMGECWGAGTATFMILGNICTRSCGFCAVSTGRQMELIGLSLNAWQGL